MAQQMIKSHRTPGDPAKTLAATSHMAVTSVTCETLRHALLPSRCVPSLKGQDGRVPSRQRQSCEVRLANLKAPGTAGKLPSRRAAQLPTRGPDDSWGCTSDPGPHPPDASSTLSPSLL